MPESDGRCPARTLHVRDLMTIQIVTVQASAPASEAHALMAEHRFRHLPVVGGEGRLKGILSNRDLFRGQLAKFLGYGPAQQDRLYSGLCVRDIMTEDVVTAHPDDTIANASRTMLNGKLGCLVVVADRAVVGILTEADFVARFAT